MRTTALAIALLFTPPAFADVADDYAACLIGQAAVALDQQPGKKDPNAAQDVAFAKCQEPTGISDEVEMDGLLDFVNEAVVTLASAK